MSLPVLIAFAGVLVSAVATGMLAGRCVRQPRIGFIVWTAATLGLTIPLAAESIGFSSGFGPATFRAVQVFALLLAPLWLSWGLVALAVLMTAGQRWPLPADAVYPLLSMLAAVLVWFAVSRVGEPSRRAAGRDEKGEGVRDASGKPGDDYWPDDRAVGDYVPEGQYVTYGQGQPGPARPRGGFPGGPAARTVPDGDWGRRPGPPPRPPERTDRYRGSGAGGPLQLATDERAGTQLVPAPG